MSLLYKSTAFTKASTFPYSPDLALGASEPAVFSDDESLTNVYTPSHVPYPTPYGDQLLPYLTKLQAPNIPEYFHLLADG